MKLSGRKRRSIVATMTPIVPRWINLVTKKTGAENLKQIYPIVATMGYDGKAQIH
jgi:hypothetical protein